MGGKVEAAKNEGEKKAADVGKKVDVGLPTVVFRTDMCCEENVKKIKRIVQRFPGVDQVKTDAGANKLTVTGKVDAAALKARLEEKIKKKVDLVSPQPAKKEGGGGAGGGNKKKAEKRSEKPSEKKPDDKPKEKEVPKESSVALKIRVCCLGCIGRMRSEISKFKGVRTVSFDMAKDLVTVMGTMDTKALVPYLSKKLWRPFEVIAPAKKDDGAGAKKDDEKAAAGSGEKKDGGGDKKKEKKGGKKEKEATPGDEKKDGGSEKKEEKKEGKKEAATGGEKKKKKEEKKESAGGGGGSGVAKEGQKCTFKVEHCGFKLELAIN